MTLSKFGVGVIFGVVPSAGGRTSLSGEQRKVMQCRRLIRVCLKSVLASVVALLWMSPLPAQDGRTSGSLMDLLIHNPTISVDFTSIEVPVRRQYSAQQLANSWNHLVDQFRANEPLFSSTEDHALTALLLHIQSGLSLTGFRSARKNTIPSSWQDLEGLLPNASELYTLLVKKRNENPNISAFRKLLKAARTLDEEMQRLAPTVPASALAR